MRARRKEIGETDRNNASKSVAAKVKGKRRSESYNDCVGKEERETSSDSDDEESETY